MNIRKNMTSADWTDVEMMLRSNSLAAFHLDGMPDEEDEIIRLFETADKRSPAGAALRWAIVAGDDGRLVAMFQGLPLSEPATCSKPQLRGDSPAIVAIESFPMWYNSFDGVYAAGPVPVIACRQESRLELSNDPLSTHREIQRMAGTLGAPIQLTYKEAVAYVKKPKASDRMFPFKRKAPSSPWAPPAAAKKARADLPPSTAKPGKIRHW
jgi:hypothetical protein